MTTMNPVSQRIAQINDQIAKLQASLDDETDAYLAEITQNLIDMLTDELTGLALAAAA